MKSTDSEWDEADYHEAARPAREWLNEHAGRDGSSDPQPRPTDSPPIAATRNGATYRSTPGGGYWIEPDRPVGHQCPLPQQWTHGALWQCPQGHLWVVSEKPIEWWPASWWQRRRYGPGMKRARLSMARTGRIRPPAPPKGGSGQTRAKPPPPPPYQPGGVIR